MVSGMSLIAQPRSPKLFELIVGKEQTSLLFTPKEEINPYGKRGT
jgi:hypothetical protein